MIFLVKRFIKASRIGRAMRAVATDQNTAALMGIDVNGVFIVSFRAGSGPFGGGWGSPGPDL